MAWFLRQGNETVGPVADETLERWIRDGLRDVYVRHADGGDWIPLYQSRWAPLTAGPKHQDERHGRLLLCAAGGIGGGMLALLVLLWLAFPGASKRRLVTDVNAAASGDAPFLRSCVLGLPGRDTPVPVASTEPALRQRTRGHLAAVTSGTASVAPPANGGTLLEPGTRCMLIDIGNGTRKVRVSEGPLRGSDVWVPAEWARCEMADKKRPEQTP